MFNSTYSSGSERERERKNSRHRERHHTSESRRCSGAGVAPDAGSRAYAINQHNNTAHKSKGTVLKKLHISK